MKGPSLYMSMNDYTTYRTGKIFRHYPEENEIINKNAFRQNLERSSTTCIGRFSSCTDMETNCLRECNTKMIRGLLKNFLC